LSRVLKTARTHEQRLRAHVLLLLAARVPWSTIALVLFTSTSTINRWRRRFLDGGLSAVIEAPGRRRTSRFIGFWIRPVLRRVPTQSPTDFGFYRSRWTCGTVVLLLQEDHGLRVGRETVRRWFHQQDLVYRRPRPVLGPTDPHRTAKLRKIRKVLRELPSDQI